MNELVSIIVPLFNGADFIESAMDVLGSVEYSPFEIICVDDGSTDGGARIIKERYPHVTLIHQDNQGPGPARNTGIKAAKGSYIGFLDIDDIYPPNATTRIMQHFSEDPSLEVVYGRTQLRELQGADDRLTRYRFREGDQQSAFLFNLGAMIVRRSVFDKVGLFTNTRFSEDVDFHFRLVQRNVNVKRINQITLIYQIHGTNMTREIQGQKLNKDFLMSVKGAIDRSRAKKNSCDEESTN